METANSNSLCCSVGLLWQQGVGAPRLEGDRQCCHPGGCRASCIPSLWHGQAGRGGHVSCSVPAPSSAQGSCAGREPAWDGPQCSKWDLTEHSLSWGLPGPVWEKCREELTLLLCSFIPEVVVMHDQQWDCFKVTFQLDFFFSKVIQNSVWEWHQGLSHKQKGQVTPS